MRLPPMEKRKSKEPYPMPDRQHVAAAIGFAKMHHPGNTALISKLRAKARRKFPGTKAKHGGAVEHEMHGHHAHHHPGHKRRKG